MTSKPWRVGVIGLGSMGLGMALSLKRAGFDVTGCDVTPEAVSRLVSEGGQQQPRPTQRTGPMRWLASW